MSRLYVSLKLKDGERIICYGTSGIKDAEKRYMEIRTLLKCKTSPSAWYKFKDFDGCVLRIVVRKNKKVRLSETLKLTKEEEV